MPRAAKRMSLGLGHRLTLSPPRCGAAGAGFGLAQPLGLGGGGLSFGLGDLPFPADYKLRFNTNPHEEIQYALFKSKVLEEQIRNAVMRHRSFTPSIPDSELRAIEPGHKPEHKLIRAAAEQCQALLEEARSDLAEQKRDDITVGIASAYRDVERETELWDSYYGNYYEQTRTLRYFLPGGEHGDAAARALALYISDRKAAPGYGNHSQGIAVDFLTTEGKPAKGKASHKVTRLGASMSQKGSWMKAWLFMWLNQNAQKFRLKPYKKEPWHWEYK